MRITTAIYGLDGSEFVFVSGDMVQLGWDSFVDGFDTDTKQDVTVTLEEFDIEDIEEWIGSQMSPVRTAIVPPMLVECHPWEIGWTKVSIDDGAAYAKWKAEIDRFEASSARRLTLSKKLRLDRSVDVTAIEAYEPVSYAELLRNY